MGSQMTFGTSPESHGQLLTDVTRPPMYSVQRKLTGGIGNVCIACRSIACRCIERDADQH